MIVCDNKYPLGTRYFSVDSSFVVIVNTPQEDPSANPVSYQIGLFLAATPRDFGLFHNEKSIPSKPRPECARPVRYSSKELCNFKEECRCADEK